MHTISFYSFKGGVGRTLALVNVGVELAMTGRRVLLVDFDLEAPGIDTFEELRGPGGQPGLVDFVTDFMMSGTPPDVLQYVYEASLPEEAKGELRVMGAGRRDAAYGQKLAAIDWQHLYSQMEGYLFIEDLKIQWAEKLMPDYVLIDSRTGHTEVGGICTRQLPDTVVILFMPNEQNLCGLKYVVQSIRNEMNGPVPKKINIEFVVSNVPNLDDEEAILARMMKRFSSELEFRSPHAIQRYDSLALLNQSIFVSQRPKSRLARQYRALLQRLAEHNTEDRTGVLRYLDRQMKADYLDSIESQREVRSRIDAIVEYHANDSEIVFASALCYRDRGLLDQSNTWFEKSVELARLGGAEPAPRALLERATARAAAGRDQDAKADLLEVIVHKKANPLELRRAIEMLRRIDETALVAIETAPAMQDIDVDEASMIATSLASSRRLHAVAKSVLMAAKARCPKDAELSFRWRNETALALIGLGEFQEAMTVIGEDRVHCQQPHIADAFNYAMASWGSTRHLPIEIIQKVVELDANQPNDSVDANCEECLALCLALLGKGSEAKARLANARNRIREVPVPTFSCWSYTAVRPPVFEEHLNAIAALIEGEHLTPEFMSSEVKQIGENTMTT
ncbi:MAG: AAA family ATPase [Planctomycetia bacterium]|nr:AAA family ATPase [Planctomycetia bacterium]